MPGRHFTDLAAAQSEVDSATDPFPGGLLAQTTSRPAGASEAEWLSVMSKDNVGWGSSVDNMCWGFAVAALTKALRDLSSALNFVVLHAEGGQLPDAAAMSVFLGKIRAVTRLQSQREAAIQSAVLPALELHLDTSEQVNLKQLQRCIKYRDSRTKAVEAALVGYIEFGALADAKALAGLRNLKSKFDVFLTTLLTLLQVEVEHVLWPVRKYLSAADWGALGGVCYPLDDPSLHILALGRGQAHPAQWLQIVTCSRMPSIVTRVHAHLLLALAEQMWSEALSKLWGAPQTATVVDRLKRRAARLLLPKSLVTAAA